MGFDLRLVQEPATYPTDYEPQEPDEPASYRLAGSSMGICRAVMLAAGVLDEEQAAPALPAWPPAGVTTHQTVSLEAVLREPDRFGKRLTAAEHELLQAYHRDREAVVTGVGLTPSGKVAAFKFGSNSGWRVTPAECRLIGEGLDRVLRRGHEDLFASLAQQGCPLAQVRELVRLWAGYNRLAADCGGYRVW